MSEPVDAPTDAPIDAPAPDDTNVDDKGEGTTPEEVAQVLKSSGINIPKEDAEDTDGADDTSEAGEGDEPDAGDDATSDTGDEEDPAKADESTDTPQFTLEVEDAEGVTHKIEKIEDLPEDFEPKNNRQIMEIISNLAKLETEKSQYETEQAEAAKAEENAKAVETIQEGWKQEFKELNITDEARREEVMEFMSKENDKRMEANKPLIRTVEHALLSLEKVEAKAEADEKAKADKETARKNGSLVGGSSAPATSKPPVYRANSARNANEAIRSLGLIS